MSTMSTIPDSVRVLHVDDEPDLADLVATFVEREDDRISVETATCADEGLSRLADADFHCVISDYDMPGKTGIEFLEAVRDDYPDLPFILFTGKGSEEVASEAISAGVTDYLQKESGTDQYAVLANRILNAVERTQAERERRRQLNAIETAQEGISILDEGGYFIYVNAAYADLYGYEPEEMVGEHWELIYRDEDVDRIRDEILPEVKDTGRWRGTTTGLRADGTTFLEDHVLATTDEGELVCTVRDITDQKERERRFEAIFNNTYQFTGLMDPDGTLLEANETALEFGGLGHEDVVGETLWDAYWFQIDETARQTAKEAVKQAREGNLFRDEVRVQGADREAIIDFSVRPVRDEDGSVSLLIPEGRDITDRKEREADLEQAERRYQAIFEDPNILAGVLDTDGTLLEINQTAMEYVDATAEEVINEPIWKTPWWTDELRTRIRDCVEQAAAGEYVDYEASLTTATGEPYYVDGLIRPVTDDADTVVSLIISARDVTDRREREQELETARDRLELALEASNLGVYDWDIQTDEITFDERVAEMLGYSMDEFEQDLSFWTDRTHSDDLALVEANLEELFSGEIEFSQSEYRMQSKDGDWIWIQSLGKVVEWTDDGSPARIVGLHQDVTDRKEHERALERNRDLLRRTEQLADTGGWETDLETGEQQWTQGTFDIHDIDVDQPDQDMVPTVDEYLSRVDPKHREAFRKSIDQCIEAGVSYDEEIRITTFDDRSRWIRTIGEPIVEDEETIKLRGATQDITEYKQQERELAELAEFQEAILENANIWINVLDGDGDVIHWNEAAERISGYSPEDVIGHDAIWEWLYPDDEYRAEILGHVEEILQGEKTVEEFETTIVTKSGDERIISWNQNLLTVDDEREAAVAIGRDVTEHKRRERQLERFASIVSHDLRGPLNVASGRLELAREECESTHLENIGHALDRMDTLIEDLLTLAQEGQEVGELENVNLPEVLQACWQTLATDGAMLQIETDHVIQADQSRLRQLLENLIRNAIDHGGEDVTVTIGALDDGFYIEDDGPGISENRSENVFEVGYSTSQDGHGIGLAIVKQISQAHGWTVRITNGDNGGARFEINGVDILEQ